MTTAKLIERGNGLPRRGDYCYDSEHRLWRVLDGDGTGGTIHTDDPRGNYVLGRVEEADYDDCPEGDEHTALVELAE
jgi:hypothetical protein